MPLTQEEQIQRQIWELEKRRKELQGLPTYGNTANYSVGDQQQPSFWTKYGPTIGGMGLGALGIGGSYLLGRTLFPGLNPSQVAGKFFNPMLRKLAATFPGAISENGQLRKIGLKAGKMIDNVVNMGKNAYNTASEYAGTTLSNVVDEFGNKVENFSNALENANKGPGVGTTITGPNSKPVVVSPVGPQPNLPRAPKQNHPTLNPEGADPKTGYLGQISGAINGLQNLLNEGQGAFTRVRDDIVKPALDLKNQVVNFWNDPMGTKKTPVERADGGYAPRYGWGGYALGIPIGLGGLSLGSYGMNEALNSRGDDKRKENAYYALPASAGLLAGAGGLIAGQKVYNNDQKAINDALKEFDAGNFDEKLKEFAEKYYPGIAPKLEPGESSSDPGYISRLWNFFNSFAAPGNTPRNSAESSDSGSSLLANGGYYPRFADGGYVRRFDDGGSTDDDQQEVPSYGLGGWARSGLDFVNWLARRKAKRAEADEYNQTRQYNYTPLEQVSQFLNDLEKSPFRPALGAGLQAAGKALDGEPQEPPSALGRLGKNAIGGALAVGIPKALQYAAGFLPEPFGPFTQSVINVLSGGRTGFVGGAANFLTGNPLGKAAMSLGSSIYDYGKQAGNEVYNYVSPYFSKYRKTNDQGQEVVNRGVAAISPAEIAQHTAAGHPTRGDSEAQTPVPSEVVNYQIGDDGGAQWTYRPPAEDPIYKPLGPLVEDMRHLGHLTGIRANHKLKPMPETYSENWPGLYAPGHAYAPPSLKYNEPSQVQQPTPPVGQVVDGPNTRSNAAAQAANTQLPDGSIQPISDEEALLLGAQEQQAIAQGNVQQQQVPQQVPQRGLRLSTWTPAQGPRNAVPWPQPNQQTQQQLKPLQPIPAQPKPADPNTPPPIPQYTPHYKINEAGGQNPNTTIINPGIGGKIGNALDSAANTLGGVFWPEKQRAPFDEKTGYQNKSALGESLLNRPELRKVPVSQRYSMGQDAQQNLFLMGAPTKGAPGFVRNPVAPDPLTGIVTKGQLEMQPIYGYGTNLNTVNPYQGSVGANIQQSPRAMQIINRFNNPSSSKPIPMTNVSGENAVTEAGDVVPKNAQIKPAFPQIAPPPTTPISDINTKNQGSTMYNTLMSSQFDTNDYTRFSGLPRSQYPKAINPDIRQYGDQKYNIKGNYSGMYEYNPNRFGTGQFGTQGPGTLGSGSGNQWDRPLMQQSASTMFKPWNQDVYKQTGNTQQAQQSWGPQQFAKTAAYGGQVARYDRGGVDGRYNRSATSVLGTLLGGALGLWGGRNYAKNALLDKIAEAAAANNISEIQDLTNQNLPFMPGALGALMGAMGGGALGYYGG